MNYVQVLLVNKDKDKESQQGMVRIVGFIIRAGLWDSEGEGVCGSESEEAETKTGGILWHPNGQVA